jgi:polyhydroxybutyrate depolymerase
MRKIVRIVVALVASLVLVSSARAGEPVEKKWTIEGVEREGLIFAPEAAKTAESPLVFAFHGHGGNIRQASRSFRIQELWPEAIVVYLQGLNTPGKLVDPEGKKPGWQKTVGDQEDRDLKLFDAVLKSVREEYKVDGKRIYCTGHSNGGGFTYLLWGVRGDVFAAVAPSSAVAPQVIKEIKPKPVLHVAGTKDPLVKFEWQKQMIDADIRVNGCETTGKSVGENLTEYASTAGTPVVTFIHDGGHAPPAAVWGVIVKFFKEHPGK